MEEIQEGLKILSLLGFEEEEENRSKLKNKDLSDLFENNFDFSPLHVILLDKTTYEEYKTPQKNLNAYPVINEEEITKNRLQYIKFLVANKCNLNQAEKRFLNTPLHLATKNENMSLEIIQYLLENKAQLNGKNVMKDSVLHCATINQNISFEIMKVLIENKSNLNQVNGKNKPPLHLAASNCNISLDIIQLFDHHKADLKVKSSFYKNSLLHTLCYNKSEDKTQIFEIVKFLCEKKAQINYQNTYKNLPIHSATKNITPSRDLIRFLVEKKSKLNILNVQQMSPLYLTIINEKFDFEIASLLIESKSELNIKSDHSRNTPLNHVCLNSAKFDLKIIKYLIEKKSEINITSKNFYTPLLNTLKVKPVSFELVKYLIENKSDTNLSDLDGNYPFHIACMNETVEINQLEYLIEKGCKINEKNEDNFLPLHFLCNRKNVGASEIQFLIEKKSTYHPNKFNDMPHHLIKTFSLEIILTFLSQLNICFSLSGNKNFDEILERHYNCSLWSIQTHHFFPPKFRFFVLVFILCMKEFSIQKKIGIFPKPLIFYLLNLSLLPNSKTKTFDLLNFKN